MTRMMIGGGSRSLRPRARPGRPRPGLAGSRGLQFGLGGRGGGPGGASVPEEAANKLHAGQFLPE
jgi:hypothetical protein